MSGRRKLSSERGRTSRRPSKGAVTRGGGFGAAGLCACCISCGQLYTFGDLGDAASAVADEGGSVSSGVGSANGGGTSGEVEASTGSSATSGSGASPGGGGDAQEGGATVAPPSDAGADGPALPAACAAASEIVYVTTLPGSTGNFGTTGSVCVVYQGSVNGWGISNGQGRLLTVIAATTLGPLDAAAADAAGTMPALGAGSDGFIYWVFTAGADSYASLYIF